MIRIAIVDDEPVMVSFIHKKIADIFNNLKIEVEMHDFTNGKLALKDIIAKSFDLVFLDIDMPEMNGIELAQKIRLTNRKLRIVYVTNYKGYYKAAFMVHAYEYLEKPITQEKINEILTEFLKEKRDEKHPIALKLTDGTNSFVDISDICYFEYDGNRKVKVHMYNKKCINISTTLSALEKQYGKYDFVFPYQSYLVNLARVESFDIKNRYLYFDNGMKVEVAEKKKKEFQVILSEYFHKRLEDK